MFDFHTVTNKPFRLLLFWCMALPTPLLFAIEDSISEHRDDSRVLSQSVEENLQHQFSAPNEQVSLDMNLDVSPQQNILEEDDRLKSRLINALDSRSEPELIKFVDLNIGEDFKRRVLLTLGEIYEQKESPSLLIALYEKFILEFPTDKEVPKLYLRLGRMYRDAGATKTALSKFYNVLNVALNVPINELKDYQEVSHRAQLEIAETFFSMGSYEKASKFFKRLLRVKLVEEDRRMVLFKYAYTLYLSENYRDAVANLKSFVNEFSESELAAEARYLLSNAYTQLGDPKSALNETLELLAQEAVNIDKNPKAWLYWKKRTGNQLANQFYHESNYLDALTIYRAMSGLSGNPEWRWPVLYQIGLCSEKLEMKPKAMEAYQEIIREGEEMKKAAFETRCGFWDIYEVMGGRNSMQAWVEADPPLAGSDYVHFTPKGARKVAEFFTKALLDEAKEDAAK